MRNSAIRFSLMASCGAKRQDIITLSMVDGIKTLTAFPKRRGRPIWAPARVYHCHWLRYRLYNGLQHLAPSRHPGAALLNERYALPPHTLNQLLQPRAGVLHLRV